MACSKYILVNSGSTTITFSYQRCDDALWQYQIELLSGETKNIWLLDGTFSSAFQNQFILTNLGSFPFPDPSPTPTPTPSETQTIPTPTPSLTPTNTPTPTS